MDAEIWARLQQVVAAMEAKKAFHLLALDVSGKTSIADAFVICSVASPRQAQAVADEVDRTLSQRGVHALSVEGYTLGTWILMDYGDFVLHIFQEERREYYALERLWGDAPDITGALRAVAVP
ncbi:MAG: ribosome silencing factor [Thermoanaerobaculum sp.]|nr:ribosome silencing factor [Thermoanaerobaculum sp.]MCX7895151.1 ribosome silencing factor [Thermoanaerobaculum sp.]MDW7966677.1 ribosome silencing factor [Thermoanaerobaculum sp.]